MRRMSKAKMDAHVAQVQLEVALGTIRMIGRLTEDQKIADICRAAIAGKTIPNDDTGRLNALEAFVNRQGALLIHTGDADCGQHLGLGLRPGTVRRTLREALDQMIARSEAALRAPYETQEGGEQ